MDYISIIGSVAGTLTTISMVPQIVKIWKTKHTQDISMGYFLILGIGVFLWVIYGFLLTEPPIYIANIITLSFVVSIIFFKLKYG